MPHVPRFERAHQADASRGMPAMRDVFEIARRGREVVTCETRENARPRFRAHAYAREEDAVHYVELATKRKLRHGFEPAGRCVLLGPAADDARWGSVLAIDELLAAGDERVVEEVLGATAELSSIAIRWIDDPQPGLRRALLAYVDDGCDRPGQRKLVKDLFKAAEARGDDELVAHFAYAFDRLTHRIPTVRGYWLNGRYVPARMMLASNPAVLARAGSQGRAADYAKNRFARATRRYLARRAFRYLRRLGKLDAARHGRAARTLLALYRDEDFAQPERLLDAWSLVHVLWAWSPVLVRDPRGVRVAPGRTLAELAPAPYFPEAFRGVRDELFALLATARSRVVRAWIVAWLEKEYGSELEGLPVAVLRPLLASEDDVVARFGAKLLRTAAGLDVLPVAEWLALLGAPDLDALAAVVAVFEARVSPKRIGLEACAALARSPAAVVAELGLRWAREKPIASPADLSAVASMVRSNIASVRTAAAAWTLELAATASLARPEHLRDLFDARHEDVRALAATWIATRPEQRTLPLWFSLVESPYDDVRALVVRYAKEWQAEAGASEIEHLAATALLSIHRGAATKQVVLRRLADRCVEKPDDADRLLPLLALALRSIRGPERTGALASIARAAVSSDAVRAAVLRHFPDLAIGTQVSA